MRINLETLAKKARENNVEIEVEYNGVTYRVRPYKATTRKSSSDEVTLLM